MSTTVAIANFAGACWGLIDPESAEPAVRAGLSLLPRSDRLRGCRGEYWGLPWVLVPKGSLGRAGALSTRWGALGRAHMPYAVFNSVV